MLMLFGDLLIVNQLCNKMFQIQNVIVRRLLLEKHVNK